MTETDEPAALRAVVRGRVQGVGFRFFVEAEAQARGLTGYVRNLNDPRSVEVVAEGPRHRLEGLQSALRTGPPLARVDRVDVTWMAVTGEYGGFSIR